MGLHSWFGSCNILKMLILPKLLFQFQTLPISIPVAFFKKVESTFTAFIWAEKRPRIPRSVLVLPKAHRGIAVPDPRRHYHAAMLTRWMDWSHHAGLKCWVGLELSLYPLYFPRAPWYLQDLPAVVKMHPTIGPMIRTCSLMAFSKGLSTILNFGQPENSLLGVNATDLEISFLRDTSKCHTLMLGGDWLSLSQLTSSNGPFCLSRWQVLQLFHFLRDLGPPPTL